MKLLHKILNIKPLLNFGIYSFGTLLFGLINLVMVPIYSNYIIPAEYGILSIIIIIINVFTLIIDCGMNTAFSIKYYKVDINQRSRYLYTILTFNSIIFIFVSSIFIFSPNLLGRLFNVEINLKVLLKILLVLILTVITNFFMNILRLKEEAGRFFIFSLMKSLLLVILTIYFLKYLKQSYESYLNSIIIVLLILFIFALLYFFKNFSILFFKIDVKGLIDLLILSFPILIGGLLNFFLASNDKYLLKMLTTSAIVGIYSMSYRFGNLLDVFLTNPLGQAISPTAFRTYAIDIEKYKSIIKNVFFLFINLGFIFILILFSYLDIFYHFFINKLYWKSFDYIIYIVFGYFFWGGAVLLSATIIVKEKTYLSTLLVFLCGTLNIGLNFLLIPRYGALGSALSILAAYFLIFILYYNVTQYFIKIQHRWKDITIISIIFICSFSFLYIFVNIEKFSIKNIIIKTLIVVIYIIISYKINKEKLRNFMQTNSSDL